MSSIFSSVIEDGWRDRHYKALFEEERQSNPTYERTCQDLEKQKEAIQPLLDDFDTDIHNYDEALYNKTVLDEDILYEQGYEDCLALISGLGLISQTSVKLLRTIITCMFEAS